MNERVNGVLWYRYSNAVARYSNAILIKQRCSSVYVTIRRIPISFINYLLSHLHVYGTCPSNLYSIDIQASSPKIRLWPITIYDPFRSICSFVVMYSPVYLFIYHRWTCKKHSENVNKETRN